MPDAGNMEQIRRNTSEGLDEDVCLLGPTVLLFGALYTNDCGVFLGWHPSCYTGGSGLHVISRCARE